MSRKNLKSFLTIVALSLLSMSSWAYELVIPEGTEKIDRNSGYQGDTSITSVVIPNSVTSIGPSTFSHCTGLTSVTIPNSVTQIGYEAFYDCTSLTSVIISNSVKWINMATFNNCKGLTSVTIPNSVIGIADYAFEGCSGLTSVEIPSSVTQIEDYAFRGCTGLTSVVIPNSVTSIGSSAFSGCSGLTSVQIPNSVTSIGSSTFSGCSGLTSVQIPNSVTWIGEAAFSGCSSLTSVAIPSSVTKIGDHAFVGCTGLTSIEVDPKNTEFASKEGVLYDKRMTNLILAPKRIKGSIEIPNSVTSINGGAFKDCTGLTSVTVPNSVTSIESAAFLGCTGLTSIEIPNSVISIDIHAFYGCTGLTSVTISNSVTSIGPSAFNSCSNLFQVSCYAVKPPYIDDGTFSKETLSDTLYVPSQSIEAYKADKMWGQFATILPIAEDAPVSITQTLTICDNELPIKWNGHWVYGDTTLALGADTVVDLRLYVNHSKETVLYDTVSCGSSYQYWGWSMKNPQSGTYVDTFTTATGCDSIVTLHLYVMGDELVIPEGTVTISYEDGYHGNKCITSVEIPSSVTYIGYEAFSGCTGLTSVEIPNSVTWIEGGAFSGCTGLTSVQIPSSVTYIGYEVFSGCTGLTSIEVDPKNAVYTSKGGILYNKEMTELVSAPEGIKGNVEIPNTVTEIGFSAFDGCGGLTSVEIPSSVTEIGGWAFYGCTGLTSVQIPSSVTRIKDGAFSGTGLKKVTIPSSVKYLDSCFSYCKSLQEVIIQNGVTSIGYGAFAGCTGLTSVEIPSSVTSIEYRAFSGCTGLTSVEIPSSVTSIGSIAFEGCTNLSRVSCYAVKPPHIDIDYYDDVFSKETLSDTLYVPSQSIEAYRADKNWGRFSTILPINDGTSINVTQTLTVCENDLPIKWNGHWVHRDTTLALGADTVVDLRLDINHSMETVLYDTVSCGSSYQYWGRSMKNPESGTYVDTFTTATGCDSIVTLHLYVMGDELVIPEGTETISYKDGYQDNKCITSVVIPSSVKEIGWSAFSGCSGLTSVEIPSSVTYIGYDAFSGCTGLTSVEIPSSVTVIGRSAFRGSTGLTSVEIPSSVTSIEYEAFYGCTGLTSVQIPSSVTSISGAFSGTGLKKVTIPSSVKYWDSCFCYCKSLQEVIIQNGVTSIEYGAFAGCTGLTSVEIPSSVTSIESIAFEGCSGLTSVEIPNSVTEIGYGAFEGCTNLSRVSCYAVKPPYIDGGTFSKETLSDTLYVPSQSIEAYRADKNWGRFVTILPIAEDAPVSITQTLTVCDNELPIKWNGHWVYGDTTLALSADTVVDLRLDINHFKETVLYDTVSCGSSYQYWGWSMKNPQSGTYVDTFTTATGCDSIVTLHLYVMGTELVIPEGTKEITYKDGYHGNKCITSVEIPSSVTYIGDYAFYGCTGLTSVEIPSSVTEIGGWAFYGCTGLTSVQIPSSVTYIGNGTFYGCTGLTSVEIPSSVTEIGGGAFSGTGLKKVTIPGSVEYWDTCFVSCNKLQEVIIQDGVTNIGWGAFADCTGLTSVEIPSSVTNIGSIAFEGCTNLSRVSCYAVKPPYIDYYDDVFSKETLSDTLYVPFQSVEAYKADKIWGQFTTILPINDGTSINVTQTLTICDNELPIKWNGHWVHSDTTLALGADTVVDLRLDINHSVKTVLYDTVTCGMSYRNWKNPQSGTYVDTFTTATGCDSIVTLHLYVNSTLVIPEGTETITYEDGYHGNKCITSVVIPSSVTEIERFAFSGCSGLTSVEVDPKNTAYASQGGILYNKEMTGVIYVPEGIKGRVEIPSSVTRIDSSAFRDRTGLTSVVIPSSVTEIGGYAFEGCTGLTSVVIPSSVTEIGYSAFGDCTSLSRVSCYAVKPPYYYYDDVFSKETLSDTLYVPSQSIEAYKADNVWGQFATILPLSEDAPVSITQTLTVCGNELPIKWNGHWVYGDTTLALSADTVVDLRLDINHSKETVLYDTIICGMSYRDWKDPQSGTYVDTFTTATGCDSIVTLHLYVSVTELVIPEGTKTITYEDGYHGNKYMTSVVIPNSVTSIGNNAFEGCTGLQSLSLAHSIDLSMSGILSTDTLIFRGSLAEWCADPITSISYKALVIDGQVYDKNTKSVVLPEGVETIHAKAFDICPNIRTLTLPSTLIEMGDGAFKNCLSIASVTCYASEPPAAMGSTFGNYNGYLYIPCDYQSDYDIHVCWGSFKHVECIAAESSDVEDVVVEPDNVTASISWPSVDGAYGYSINISINGRELFVLNFNANGQLVNIDFSHAIQSVNPAPPTKEVTSMLRKGTSLRSMSSGFMFTVTGLEEGTTYDYTLTALDESSVSIKEYEGKFTTKGGSGILTSTEEEVNKTLFVYAQDGEIIVGGNPTEMVSIYNILGQRLYHGRGNVTFQVPSANVYIVKHGAQAIKVVVE